MAPVVALTTASVGASRSHVRARIKVSKLRISEQVSEHAKASGGQLGIGFAAMEFTPGPGVANRLRIFVDPGGRLAFRDPSGVDAPPADPKCQQDSVEQVSCDPGYVDAFYGTLGAGHDHLTTAPGVKVALGTVINGRPRAMYGGVGNDRIRAGEASDVVFGGQGGDLLFGRKGVDYLLGGAGRDSLAGGKDCDFLSGGEGGDHLNGGAGLGIGPAGLGCDSLRGGSGRDKLQGGAGFDYLAGGPGHDRLNGGKGLDLCFGGGRRDAFKGCELKLQGSLS